MKKRMNIAYLFYLFFLFVAVFLVIFLLGKFEEENNTYFVTVKEINGYKNVMLLESITIVSTNISACDELDQANTIYTQIANIVNNSIAGACINITAENVTFNGNGFSITSAQNVSGIYSNKFNTTVQHTNISMGIGVGGFGIYLTNGANNATVFNNTLGQEFKGIFLSNVSYGIIEKNNLSFNCFPCNGINVANASSFNNVTSNVVLSTKLSNVGIGLGTGSNNNILTSNTVNMGDGQGMGSTNTSHNIFIKNTAISRNNTGFAHTNDVNITHIGDNATATGGDGSINSHNGIYLFNVSNSTFTSVIGSSNSTYGIGLQLSFNNTFNSVIGVSNVSAGIRIENSSNNVFTNSQALGLLPGSYGFYLFNATGTAIIDCINVSGIAYDIYLSADSRSSALITNCSYNSETVNGVFNSLTRQWYYRAYVNNSAGAAISGVKVSAYNRTGQLSFTIGPTDNSGFTQRTTITDYVNLGGTKTYYSNYMINATNGSSTKEHGYNVTLTRNNLNDFFTFTPNMVPLPPVLSFIGNKTVSSSFTDLVLQLSATDPNNDPLTFSVSLQSIEYILDQQLGLSFSGSDYLNWGGRNEKWVIGSGGIWYYITPDGKFYRWLGGSLANDPFVEQVSLAAYTNTAFLYNAAVNNAPAVASISGSTLTLNPTDGFVGKFVTNVSVSDGKGGSDSESFFVDVQAGGSVDTIAPTVTNKIPVNGAVINTSSFNIDITFSETVVNVDVTDLVLSGSGAINAVKSTPINIGGATWRFPISNLVNGSVGVLLAPDPNDIEDTSGNDLAPTSWSFMVNLVSVPQQQPPTLSFIGNRTTSSTTNLVIPLSATDPNNDPLTFSVSLQSIEYILDQQLGLSFSGSDYLNWGGRNEKWVIGSGGIWYYITPDGKFYRWLGGSLANDPFVEQVSLAAYTNTALLYNAAVNNAPAVASISGSTLTLNPTDGFVGKFVANVSVSDGKGGSDSESFFVTVF